MPPLRLVLPVAPAFLSVVAGLLASALRRLPIDVIDARGVERSKKDLPSNFVFSKNPRNEVELDFLFSASSSLLSLHFSFLEN